LFSTKGVALFGLGKINMNFYSALIALPFSFIVSYYFILKYGIIGAAYGNIAAQIFIYLISSYQFSKANRQMQFAK
jgi:Na+-driven multidrug efflux pump